jgi:SAM-dependent methyltransferase
MNYGPMFFDAISSGCQRSAAKIVPVIYDMIHPLTVIDVGCGEGWWGKVFEDLGCQVLGIDGEYVEDTLIDFHAWDLEKPFNLDLHVDLVICLEVAEHLTPERAVGFIADLCRLAPVILFSAAIPGQGGQGHINCQWPTYWAELFADEGFVLSGSIRNRFWDDNDIEPWYRQNLMIATSDSYSELQDSGPLNRIHPLIQAGNSMIALP